MSIHDDRSEPSAPQADALVLHTPHLRMIAATPAIIRADLKGPHALDRTLGVARPREWPPELLERDDLERMLRVAERPGRAGFNSWYLVTPAQRMRRAQLVGIAGLGSPPSDDRLIMVGYSIVPSARRRGYATEATRALIEFALAQPGVDCVFAETYPVLVASIGVLEKVGFRPVDGGSEPGVIRFAYP